MFDFLKKKKSDNWTNIANKAINNYYSLNYSERIWFNCQVIIDSTQNGGLISYYYNSGAENVYDAIDDIKSLGFENIAGIIQKYNLILFKGLEVPTDIYKRNEYINSLDESTDELLQSLETELTKLLQDFKIGLETFLRKEKMIE
jgi:hypothetical protein